MTASENPEKNVQFLTGCLYRNWMWGTELARMLSNITTDANVLYIQLRADCAAQGETLDEGAIRRDLKTIEESCKTIDEAIARLRERDMTR